MAEEQTTVREAGRGTLYLTATPIGNLDDMTPRALAVLREADLIAAEDTRRTLQLLNHFGIRGSLVRYDENNKEKEGPVLLEKLLAGQDIALVTDAGFPGISDPGEAMARLAIAAGIRVVPVPGANVPHGPRRLGPAVDALLFRRLSAEDQKEPRGPARSLEIHSGHPRPLRGTAPHPRCAAGNPGGLGRPAPGIRPRADQGARRILARHRIRRHRLSRSQPAAGEFVLVIGQGEAAPPDPAETAEAPLDTVRRLIAEGVPKKEALARVAKERKVPKRELYNALLKD